VTVAEIQCGISRVRDQAVAAGVRLWLDGMLQDGRFGIVGLDLHAALSLGQMWAAPGLRDFLVSNPRSRRIRNGADLAIAAASIARELVIVTGNIADFLRIHALFPLPGLFNPFDAVGCWDRGANASLKSWKCPFFDFRRFRAGTYARGGRSLAATPRSAPP
jgi:hypothetical protein